MVLVVLLSAIVALGKPSEASRSARKSLGGDNLTIFCLSVFGAAGVDEEESSTPLLLS